MHTVILSTRSEGLLSRWRSSLEHGYRCLDAGSSTEVMGILAKDPAALTLLHRPGADPERVAVILRHHPDTRVLVLSDHPEEDEGIEFLRAGAAGYGNSHMTESTLRSAVAVIASGGIWVARKLMLRLIRLASFRADADRGTNRGRLSDLTDREYEVACLVADGYSNKQIARALDISERTVKAHLNAGYRKAGVSGRLPLALAVLEPAERLVEPG